MIDDVAATINRLRSDLESLMVRGVRAVEPGQLALLRAARDELTRIGAEQLAASVDDVVTAIDEDAGAAPGAIFRAMTILRLFERVLTLDAAAATLESLTADLVNASDTEGDD